MNICLYDEETGGLLADYCTQQGHILIKPPTTKSAATVDQQPTWLSQADVVLIEASQPTPAIHFALAQAVLLQKPTFCVYKKNHPPRQLIAFIRNQRSPRCIQSFSYTKEILLAGVKRFLDLYASGNVFQDQSTYKKFTLRITPLIDRYVDWVAEVNQMNKADVIREILETAALNDLDYQRTKTSASPAATDEGQEAEWGE